MGHFLVTGGCGFVGSHLADRLLSDGHSVRILDDLSTGHAANKPAAAELVVGDITDGAEVAAAMTGVDGCFHLAAVASVVRSNEDWAATHRANQTGTINVFDAARPKAVPVVYVSSAAVYGDNPAVPLAEAEDKVPLSAYGADKLGCEMHARVAFGVHGVPNIGLRPFNIYGPRQDPSSPYSGVISLFARRLSRGEGITIFGDGEQVRDFVYVGDVVRILIAAMLAPPRAAEVFNLCTGQAVSINELARAVAELCGVKLRTTHAPPRAGDIRRSIGDPEQALEHLGLAAETSLEDGLRQTIEWMRAAD